MQYIMDTLVNSLSFGICDSVLVQNATLENTDLVKRPWRLTSKSLSQRDKHCLGVVLEVSSIK